MSLIYLDHNSAEHRIAGISPGGNIEYGAVATRQGTITIPSLAANTVTTTEITFSEPMPDNNYEVTFTVSSLSGPQGGNTLFMPFSKTPNSFLLAGYNGNSAAVEGTILVWKAFKLYEVAEAEQLASAVDDIEAMIPASASSSNKFATVGDLSTETRSLDRRIDTLEDAVPVGTSISNQLINQTQLTNAIENVEIDVDDALDSTSENPVQNKVIANALQNVEIDVDSSISGTSENPVQNKVIKAALDKKEDVQFTGTKAEWDELTTAEKKEYKIANITDDVIGGEVADTVADGDMRPVTSNAVYDKINDTYVSAIVAAGNSQTFSNLDIDSYKYCTIYSVIVSSKARFMVSTTVLTSLIHVNDNIECLIGDGDTIFARAVRSSSTSFAVTAGGWSAMIVLHN